MNAGATRPVGEPRVEYGGRITIVQAGRLRRGIENRVRRAKKGTQTMCRGICNVEGKEKREGCWISDVVQLGQDGGRTMGTIPRRVEDLDGDGEECAAETCRK